MQVRLVGLPSVTLIYRYRSDYYFTNYEGAVQPVTIVVRLSPTLS